MPLQSTNMYAGGPIKAADVIQFFNLFTGVMTDQPVTLANTLTVGGSQSDASVPLRVSSQTTGTARAVEVRTLQADANPVFGVSRLGVLSFGAGGGTATDTTITRSGVNQLTFSGNVGVGGSALAAGSLLVGGTENAAAGGYAVGGYFNTTLQAAVNNDVLTGVYVSPVFTPGAFTGVQMHGIFIPANSAAQASATKYGINVAAQTGANASNFGIYVAAPSGAAQNTGIRVAGGSTMGIQIDGGGLGVLAGNVGIGAAPLAYAGLYIVSAITAAGGNGYGQAISSTITAGANNDNLYGITISPTYAPGAFTGTNMVGVRVLANATAQASASKFGILIDAQSGANTNNYGIYVAAPSGGSGENFGIKNLGTSYFGASIGIGQAPSGTAYLGIAAGGMPGWVAGVKYVVWDPATGLVRVSALGPAS